MLVANPGMFGRKAITHGRLAVRLGPSLKVSLVLRHRVGVFMMIWGRKHLDGHGGLYIRVENRPSGPDTTLRTYLRLQAARPQI